MAIINEQCIAWEDVGSPDISHRKIMLQRLKNINYIMLYMLIMILQNIIKII